MRRFQLGQTLVVASVALMVVAATPLDAAALPALAGKHRIDTNPTRPAFRFGLRDGFSPATWPRFTVYGDGRVVSSGKPAQALQGLRLTTKRLNGLLRLAESVHFFALPAHIGAEEPAPDAGSAFIAIHTTTQNKTVVKSLPGTNRAFDRLFAALFTAVGQASPTR